MEHLRSAILLSPDAMGFFPTLLMQIIILVFLLFWRQKSLVIWLLIGWQCSLMLLVASFFAGLTIYAPLGGYIYWIGCITFAWIANIFIIQFAYHVPRLLYPREARIVLVLSLMLGVALLTMMYVEASRKPRITDYGFDTFYYGIVTTSQGPSFFSAYLFDVLHPIAFLWVLFIWLRQSVHLSLQATTPHPAQRSPRFSPRWWRWGAVVLWSPRTREALVARMMALFFSLGFLSAIASMLEERTIVPEGSFATSFLIVFVVFVLIYLDYSFEPTTFKVKLVGISLATMMLLIGFIAPVTLQWAQQYYHEARREELVMIRHLITHNLTDQMPPKVLYVATRPAESGLFASSYQIRFQRTPDVRPQIFIEQDARLSAMTKHELTPVTRGHLVRVFPWLKETSPLLLTSEKLQRLSIPEGAVSYRGRFDQRQQHFIRYTFSLDEQTLVEVGYSYLVYRQILHQRALPLVWLTAGAVLLFLLLVPFSLQVSLVKPLKALLEGVCRVESGDLDVEVPVGVNDEIGFLTGAFNRMVDSLRTTRTVLLREIAARKQKEQDLAVLTATLEQQVADRTRALSSLYEVSSIAGQSHKLETLAHDALPCVLKAVQSGSGLLYLREETPETSATPIFRLVSSLGLPAKLLASLETLSCNQDTVSQIEESGEPVLIKHLDTEKPISLLFWQKEDMVLLVVPLSARGEVRGLLLLLRHEVYKTEEIGLVTSLARHIGKAVETHTLYQQAQRLALLEERQRLARDLHDSITQSLYGLVMLTEAGQAQLDDRGSHSAGYTFGRIGKTARQIIKEIRLFIHQLRPSMLEQEGLVGALHMRMAAVEGRADIQTNLLADETIRLPSLVEENLYQIAQEALNNVLRHAQATSVVVVLRYQGNGVVLEVCDNGCGFEADGAYVGGMGLENMRSRA